MPQGSLIGPLFFVIFVSDLPDVVIPGNTVALYADACKTSGVITCPSDQQDFQSDLGNLCTVEPRFNEVAGDRPNLFVKSRA